jgi:hypothetical protein
VQLVGLHPEEAVGKQAGLLMIVIAWMIVVVIIPIALGVPAMIFFAPPAMAVIPAIAASSGKLRAILGRLRAVPTVVFGSFMELVIYVGNTFVTVVFGMQRGGTGKK